MPDPAVDDAAERLDRGAHVGGRLVDAARPLQLLGRSGGPVLRVLLIGEAHDSVEHAQGGCAQGPVQKRSDGVKQLWVGGKMGGRAQLEAGHSKNGAEQLEHGGPVLGRAALQNLHPALEGDLCKAGEKGGAERGGQVAQQCLE